MTRCPCTPTCPKRSAECHSTCKEYRDYDIAHKKELNERYKNIKANSDLYEFTYEGIRQTLKRRKRK